MPASSSIFDSVESEKRWIDQIHKYLAQEVRVELEPVSIFRVPATLSIYKPEAYVPQLVALGPYHHFRPELYEMERFKLAAASRRQKESKTLEFKELVKALNRLEYRVRACYHKYLDMEGETLASIMAIDGLFFLDFLRVYDESPATTMTQVADSTGRKLAYGSILGDLMMLENQIPIFVLGEILSIQCSSISDLPSDVDLPPMLINFLKSFSPVNIKENPNLFKVSPPNHLLDLLYNLLVPKLDKRPHEPNDTKDQTGAPNLDKTTSFESFDSSTLNNVLPQIWGIISKFQLKIVKTIKGPINGVINILSTIPVMSNILPKKDKDSAKPENETTSKPPEVEEINIPSVTNLSKYGVKFSRSTGGIETVAFDLKTNTFTLPVITLDVHSEVVMRNLVAYEASIAPESLVFTRYMELMHGIIDTAEDARILKGKKIIVSNLKTDAEVAEMFNGMSKSVKITSVPHIDDTIRDVNAFYHTMKTVRIFRRMRKFMYHSWKLLTLIAVVLLMLMMGLQSFCSVYVCSKVFGTITSSD